MQIVSDTQEIENFMLFQFSYQIQSRQLMEKFPSTAKLRRFAWKCHQFKIKIDRFGIVKGKVVKIGIDKTKKWKILESRRWKSSSLLPFNFIYNSCNSNDTFATFSFASLVTQINNEFVDDVELTAILQSHQFQFSLYEVLTMILRTLSISSI